MSLIKQLWLTIVILLILAFVGSLFVSISSSRHYIEQEIRIKNSDNANALALSMSQLEKDPVILELLLAAQFDTGHYRRIELRDPEGEIIERRVGDETIDTVPAWFASLIQFDVPPGRAVVQDGWRQYGTLILESHHSFAYHSLWRSSLTLAGWFAIAGAISLLLAAWIVRTIRLPLRNVVRQAKAIGEQRFVESPEPRTRELRELVRAMNRLAENVRGMLGRESEKLDQLRRRLQHDPVTDTLARAPFLEHLEVSLGSHSHDASGTLAMIRVGNLAEINQQLGHQKTDALLVGLARSLKQLSLMNGDGRVGRLNGSDFALLIPRAHDLKGLGEELTERLEGLASEYGTLLTLPSALTEYRQGKSRETLMASLDGALAAAENQGELGQVIVESSEQEALFTSHDEWRNALEKALQQGVYLAHFPVLDTQGKLLHYEAPTRLKLKGEWHPAGVFLPWISRLDMSTELDLAAVAAALDDTAQSGKSIGINLSPRSLRDGRFVSELISLLRAHPEGAARLWLELPEAVAVQNPTGFSSLCREVQTLGCRMGLEHATSQFAQIEGLQHLGLSYLKIDASLSKDIEHHQEHQSLLRGMATLAHSLGILIIAEGVESRTAAQTLFDLGLDGATGPGVRQNGSELID
ncbi:EAL domain-containing protein [Halomonas campisalis]|uniref:EAL domain-containing protein n=1 Tax=Billgrantia campisalis TaxID=74661 RepID=A0ABS9PD62_9GAMM|nr:EAL domain-containing protein [Halomonas campisalis]MCG6659676.1 EAL domain-containing protein [Halomonas campisalis]MDR5864632.1 EAL domain-containing protein [Halomonas campisalis]